MKKVIYIVIVLVILLGLSALLRNNQPEPAVVEETIAVVETAEPDVAVVDEAEVVVVDEEPAGEAVDVVEENPEQTADEDETVIEE